MKPSPLSNDADPVDELLRANRVEIADDGFSERLLAVLPARPVPRAAVWNLRALTLLTAAILGCVLFAWLGLPLLAVLPWTSPNLSLFVFVAAAVGALGAVGGALLALVEESGA